MKQKSYVQFAREFDTLSWLSNSCDHTIEKDNSLVITCPAKTDFFIDPAGGPAKGNSPFLYREVTGDLIMSVKVTPNFTDTYDAGGLFVMAEADIWAKLVFERTDLGHTAVVSVVTNRVSDDANGIPPHDAYAWLQIVRRGRVFAMHYSPDGEQWQMIRYFTLPLSEKLKAGLLCQSPLGQGISSRFEYFVLSSDAPEDIRRGT